MDAAEHFDEIERPLLGFELAGKQHNERSVGTPERPTSVSAPIRARAHRCRFGEPFVVHGGRCREDAMIRHAKRT